MGTLLMSVAAFVIAWWPNTVAAHATPVEYIPSASSQNQEMPEEIRIKFSERVESENSSITVQGKDGVIVNGAALIDATNPYLFRSQILSGGDGPYVVAWRVTSADDGHASQGAFTFAVGAGYDAALLAPEVSYEVTPFLLFKRGAMLVLGVLCAFLALLAIQQKRWILGGLLVVANVLVNAHLAKLSHAAASYFIPMLSQVIMGVHLLGKEFLVAALVALAVKRGVRLWYVVLVAYLLTVFTGGYVVWLHLKDPANVLVTSWGRSMIELFVCGGAMVIGAVAVLALHGERRQQIAWVVTMVGCVSLLVCSTRMSVTVPPLSVAPHEVARTNGEGQKLMLGYATYPAQEVVLIGRPVLTSEPEVLLTKEDGSIGPINASLTERAPYGYGFSIHELMPVGKWNIKIVINRDEQQTYPLVLHAVVDSTGFMYDAPPLESSRQWDSMAMAVVVAMGIALFPVVMILAIVYKKRQKLLTEIA